MQVQRMAGLTGRTAASTKLVEWLVWSAFAKKSALLEIEVLIQFAHNGKCSAMMG